MSQNRMIGFLLVAAASTTFPACGEGVNAFSYIQKGLAACYDGVENAGAGVHDANATTWVDLTGNGNDGTVARRRLLRAASS